MDNTYVIMKINYLYNSGSFGFGLDDSMSLSDLNKMTIFVDYKFNAARTNVIVYELGATPAGISLYFYQSIFYLMIGKEPSGTESSFHYAFENIQIDQNRHLIALELIKLNDTNNNSLSVKLYYDNQIILSVIKDFDQSHLICNDNGNGFGRNRWGFSIHDDTITKNPGGGNGMNDSTDITGQFKMFQNTYDEVVQSNYFSNL